MKKTAMLALSLLMAPSAHAIVAGTWTGTGEWTYEGSGTTCPMMTLRYSESDSEFQRLGGYFDCGIVTLHSDPLTWTKQGNQLLLDGKEAGSWTENSFVAREGYGEKVSIETRFTVSNGEADYLEVWHDEKGREIYVITGKFARKK